MLRNYLVIALRFFARQRSYSIINLFGLTLGVACSLLIFLYVQDELLFDKFHRDADAIYRLGQKAEFQGKINKTTLTGFPVGKVAATVDGVDQVARLAAWKTFPVKFEDNIFTEDYLLLADSNFFEFFSFELIHGDPKEVLKGQRKLVLSESAAKKYFGYKGVSDSTPIGKTLVLAQGYTATVSGIAADPPTSSHFHYSIVLSLASWEAPEPGTWFSNNVLTYVKFDEDAADTKEKLISRLQAELNVELTELRKTNLEEYKNQGNDIGYFLQPLTAIHLTSHLQGEIEINGNLEYVILFSSVAVFIILLACINFMNLTTAQSAGRAKEVAVRKAVGAQNNRLIVQFLLESYIYVVIAVITAVVIVVVAMKPFNYFTDKNIDVSALTTAPFLLGILLFVLITGLVAGSYPAFYLTHFSPVDVMKGVLRERVRSYGIRNVLVVFQFFISAGLIIATLVVYLQLQHLRKMNVGFDKENVINLLHTRNLGDNASNFKKDILKEKGIIAASYCNRVPPNIEWQAIFRPRHSNKDFSVAVYEMDHDHLKTMGYQMVAGEFFSEKVNDSSCVILNETAATKLGLRDSIGTTIFTNYDTPSGRNRKLIGIIKDFNFQSLKTPIQSLAVIPGYQPNWEMAIRVEGNIEKHISIIKGIYKKYAPDAPFEYSLVQTNFEAQNQAEQKIGVLFLLFTFLAISIACLGLFGLASFTAQQQRKSIGIRKVLGATVGSIVLLLNKEFLRLVLIANVIAWPVAGWLMTLWLDQFAYHIDISWWIYMAAALTTVIIALFSISAKAYSAAEGNPVNSLRNE